MVDAGRFDGELLGALRALIPLPKRTPCPLFRPPNTRRRNAFAVRSLPTVEPTVEVGRRG